MKTPVSTTNDTVVIALGNRFRGDDAAGPCVADRLRHLGVDCRIVDGAEDALAIMDAWQEARTAIVVDALDGGGSPGAIRRIEFGIQPLPKDLARCSSHGLGIAEAIELSRVMGRLPASVIIYAIEAASFEPGAPLSPAVRDAVETVADRIASEVCSLQRAD